MRLLRIVLDDFLTYDHLDYTFESRPLLIQGLNLTDEGQTTNGTGKSGLQTGIEQCITASNSRDVRDNEIITYGKKQARAQLYASCDVRKETLHIDWDIKLTGSNVLRLKIKKHGEDWLEDESDGTNKQRVSFSNVNDGKKFIMDWFAISREDLFNYYIINKTRFKSFFQSSNTDKVALINRFSDASIIEGIEKIDLTDTTEKYDAEKVKIDETAGKISLLEEQILDATSKDFSAELESQKEVINADILEIEEEIIFLSGSIITLNSTKPEIEKKIAVQKKDTKATIDSLRKATQSKIDKVESAIETAQREFDKADKLVSDFKATDFKAKRTKVNTEIETVKKSKETVKAEKEKADNQLDKLIKFIKGIEVILSGAISCPNCQHVFVLEGDIKTLETNKTAGELLKDKAEKIVESKKVADKALDDNISKLQQSISDINKEQETENESKNLLTQALNNAEKALNTVKGNLKIYQQELREIESSELERTKTITSLEAEKSGIKTKVDNINIEIANYKTEISLLEQKRDGLVLGSSKSLIVSLKKDKSTLETLQLTQKKAYAALGDKIYEGNQWIYNFKQFRMHLANQSLEVIEYHCNRYLAEMRSDLSIKMEGFKVLANGSFKEEITAIIIRELRERTFSSFSGGERGRLLFASILANRHMINETHPYGGLDFLAIDEVFEGVDASGLESLISSAKLLNIPVMVITHVPVDETNANVLTIVKENNISKIK